MRSIDLCLCCLTSSLAIAEGLVLGQRQGANGSVFRNPHHGMNDVTSLQQVSVAKLGLEKDGYCIIPRVLSIEECDGAVDLMWDYLEDTTYGVISRTTGSASTTTGARTSPPRPCRRHDGHVCHEDAGWLMGHVREVLADRLFRHFYDTRELHSAKEGFIFHTANLEPQLDQHEQAEVHKRDGENGILASAIVRGLIALAHNDDSILLDTGATVHLQQGDVLLWQTQSTDNLEIRFDSLLSAYAYCTQQPASATPDQLMQTKLDAYKQRQTGDCQPHRENWISPLIRPAGLRPFFRTGPPLLSYRQAELYGLVSYQHDDSTSRLSVVERALMAGVRFVDDQAVAQTDSCRSVRYDHEFGPHVDHLCAPKGEESNMAGQDKYLGGMASSCGRYVYGVPGGARRVLRIRVADGRMDWIGPSFDGRFKWLRGVDVPPSEDFPDYPSGCCVALPCNSASLLKINPACDNAVHAFGQAILKECGSRKWHYHGGNLASNGFIYAIPANARRVLKFHPYTEELAFIGPDFGAGLQKWYGGIIGCDGCIYGIPHNERGVLKIDPTSDTVELLYCEGNQLLPDGLWKWHGGIKAGHKIYGFPNNADSVLVVDCKAQTVSTLRDESLLQSGRHRIPQDGCYKYLGGALSADQDFVYLFPCDAERVLRINCRVDTISLIGPSLLEGANKWQNGFTGRDASGILHIVPASIAREEDDRVDLLDCGRSLIGVKDKFEGGVLGHDGSIYCIPLRSRVCVKVTPAKTLEQM